MRNTWHHVFRGGRCNATYIPGTCEELVYSPKLGIKLPKTKAKREHSNIMEMSLLAWSFTIKAGNFYWTFVLPCSMLNT